MPDHEAPTPGDAGAPVQMERATMSSAGGGPDTPKKNPEPPKLNSEPAADQDKAGTSKAATPAPYGAPAAPRADLMSRPFGKSGSDLLEFLIKNTKNPKIRAYWEALPKAVATQVVLHQKCEEHNNREMRRIEMVKRILHKHDNHHFGGKINPEDCEFLLPTSYVDATLGMSWYYGVSSLHLNGKVFNPTASPTFSNVGDMVPLPQVATYCSDMHVYMSPPLFNQQDGASIAEPYLTTPCVGPDAAKEAYAFLEKKNIKNHLCCAMPPPGELRFTTTTGRECATEVKKVLDKVKTYENLEVVEETYTIPYKGWLSNGRCAQWQ